MCEQCLEMLKEAVEQYEPLVVVPPSWNLFEYDGRFYRVSAALMGTSPQFPELMFIYANPIWCDMAEDAEELLLPTLIWSISHESIHQALHRMGKPKTSGWLDNFSGAIDQLDASGFVTEKRWRGWMGSKKS